MSGEGSDYGYPTNARRFSSITTASGEITVDVVATLQGATWTDSATIYSVHPRVETLTYRNDATGASPDPSNRSGWKQLILTKWEGEDKGEITGPQFQSFSSGSSMSKAAAYVRGGSAFVEATLTGDQVLSNSVYIEVKGVKDSSADEDFYSEAAIVKNFTWSSGELVLESSPIHTSVNHYSNLVVDWYYRMDSGDWIAMNTSDNPLYTVLEAPRAAKIYDFALHHATGATGINYAEGAVSRLASAINICSDQATTLYYNPMAEDPSRRTSSPPDRHRWCGLSRELPPLRTTN